LHRQLYIKFEVDRNNQHFRQHIESSTLTLF